MPRKVLTETEQGPPQQAEPGARRVLIIEDDAELRELMRKRVKAFGHVVEVAADGVAVLEQIDGFKPEVVIVDLGLPGLDGYAVARQIRVHAGGTSPVLIAHTAFGGSEIRQASFDAGFDVHLVKPVAASDLIAALKAGRRTPPS